MLVTTNQVSRELRLLACRLVISGWRAAPTHRDPGPKTRVGGARQSSDDFDDAVAHVRVEILQQLLLLVDEAVGDALVKPSATGGHVESDGAAVRRILTLLDIALLHERANDP